MEAPFHYPKMVFHAQWWGDCEQLYEQLLKQVIDCFTVKCTPPQSKRIGFEMKMEVKFKVVQAPNQQGSYQWSNMLLGSEFANPTFIPWRVIGRTSSKLSKFWIWKSKSITPQNKKNLGHGPLHIWSKSRNPSLRAMVNFHMKPQYSPILRIER